MARVTTRRFGNGPRDGREDNYRDDLYRDGQEGHGGHERADYDDAGYDDADYVEYGVVDDDAAADAAAAGEEYHGSHRRADADDAEADYADAGYEHAGYPERAARTEQAERAGGAGAAEGGSTAVAAGGVPKRGLAMILIAVAALLLLWGIYAMTQRDTSSDTSAESSASQSVAAPSQDAQGQNSQGQNTQGQNTQGQSAAPSANQASPASPSAASPSANPANPANPSAANPSAGQDAGQQNLPAAQPNAEGGQGLQASDAEVLVYNNSGVPNAAQETADKLHNQYRVANDSHDVAAMNMPEQNYGVFPETYVFYNPQVAGADKVAADVARQVGGTPRSTKDLPGGGLSLPAQANNPNAITVVIAG